MRNRSDVQVAAPFLKLLVALARGYAEFSGEAALTIGFWAVMDK
jgi:hypothetical protein